MYHKDCEGRVFVDVSASYRMLADVSASKDGSQLNTVEIHVYNIKEVCEQAIYWCLTCDREIDTDELGFTCRSCGVPVQMEDGRLPSESGGIYCLPCYEDRCTDEDCHSLSDVFTYESVIVLT